MTDPGLVCCLQQFAPCPGDTPAVLLSKHQKLLFVKQVYEAWLAQAVDKSEAQQEQACVLQADKEQQLQLHAPAPCGVTDLRNPAARTLKASGLDRGCPTSSCRVQQPGPSPSEPQQQEPSSLQQQHGPAPVQPRRATLRQLLGTASTDGLPAGDMEQQSDQGHPEQLQQQQPQTTMPPPPAVQQPTSHKQLLARLLQPGNKHEGAAATAAAAPWSGASIPNARQQQQKQRVSFGAAPVGRQRRLQHGRFSLLDMPANLAPGAEGRLGPWQHDPFQESCGDTPGPQEQQQLLRLRAHHLLDAQSQAPGAAAAAAQAGGPAVPEPAVFAGQQRPASTAQQLLSPKTATHAPLQAAGTGGGSRHGGRSSGGPTSSSMQRSKHAQAVERTDRHAQSLSALLKQQRPHQQQGPPLPQEQPEEIEVTPSQAPAAQPAPGAVRLATASGLRGQAWGSGLAAVAAGGTTGTLHAQPAAAHASTAPRAAAAECGDTPATADADLVAAVGSRRAAAAGLAAALFHTPAPVAVRSRAAAPRSPPAAGVAAAAAAGAPPSGRSAAAGADFVAGSSPLDETQPSAAPPVGAACGSASAMLGPKPTEEDVGLAAVAAAAADSAVVAGSSPVDETQPPSQHAHQQQMSTLLADPAQVPGAAGMLAAPVGFIARLESALGGQPSPVLVAGARAAAAAGTGLCEEQAPERIPATPISSAGCDTGVLQPRCSGAARHRLSGASLAHDLLPSFAAAESSADERAGNSGVAALPDGIPGSSMSSGQIPPHQQQEQWEQVAAQQQQEQQQEQQQDAAQQQQEQEAAGRTAHQNPPKGAGEVQQQGQQEGLDVCPAAAADAVGAAAVSRKRIMQQAASHLPRPKQPRPSPLTPAYRLSSCQEVEVEPSATPAGAAAGGPQSPAVATAACSSTGSILLDRQQHRVQRFDLGLPVVHITSCRGYAAVVLQAPQGSTSYNLLLLQLRTLQQQHELLACQQQPQQFSVELTAVCAPALVGPSMAAPPPPAAGATATAGRLAASAQQQHSSLDLLKSGLLLLPGPSSSGQSAAGGCTEQIPLLAVVSQLHLQAHGSQSAAAATPAQAAPAAAGAAPQVDPDAQRGNGSSSSRRKLRVPAADMGDTHVGADHSHAVNIYQLAPAAGQGAAGGGVCERPRGLLVQSLPTARPVKCLAACAQPGLLAAAGAGGFACVWPLAQQQQQQQQPLTAGRGGVQQPAAEAGDQVKAAAEAGWCGTGSPGDTCSYADAAACMVLPAAHYRGIEFPDIAEVCFIVQGASGPVQHQQQGQHGDDGASAVQQQGGQQQQQGGPSGLHLPGGQKVLLVGCCSQGPVAVWDVGLCQQILSVHSPEVRLCRLMPPGGAAAVAAFGAAVRAAQAGGGGLAAGASTIQQQLPRLTDPVVCLAMAWSPDCSSSEGTPSKQTGAAAAAVGAVAATSSVARQAQQRQLRGVWLDADGHMQLGRPLIQPGPGCGVAAAALCGSTAAVLTTGGAAQVWDVVSGKRHMCTKRCSTAVGTGLGSVALVPLLDPAAVDDDCRSGELDRQASSTCHGGLVMLMGSDAGMLTSVLV